MKNNKAISQPEIPAKSESPIIHTRVSKNKVILIAFVSVLIGFILGATVAILKTKKGNKIAGPSEESQRESSIEREEDIKLLKAALEKDPNDLETLIDLANAYFDMDRFQEAIGAYSKTLLIDPKNPDVRTDMGIMYRKVSQFEKALEAFRQAAQNAPKHLTSRLNLGAVLEYDKNDYPRAIQAWEEFLKLEPYMEPSDGRIEMVKQEIKSMKASLAQK